MKKLILSTVFLLLTSAFSHAQGWEKLFSFLNQDVFRSVVEVPSGGYIAAGYISEFSPNDTDAYVVRVDVNGDTMWTYRYNGPNSRGDLFYKVINTSDGGFALCGYSSSVTGLSDDIMYMKLNSSGQQQWVKFYGGNGKEHGQDIIQTADGKYAIVGYTTTSPAQYYDAILIRANSNGDTLFTKRYGQSNYDDANSVRELSDGGFIMGGQSTNGSNMNDQFLIRTNSTGDTLWTKRFGTAGNDNIECIRVLSDGYIMAGSTNSNATGDDGYIVKTDTSGNILWTKTYGTSKPNDFHSIEKAGTGYVLCGTSSKSTGNDTLPSIWVVRTNSTGDTLWTRTFGGLNHDHGYSAVPTSDGGYIIAGFTSSFGFNWDEAYLLKIDGSGNLGNPLVYTTVLDILTPNASTCGTATTPVKIVLRNFGNQAVANYPCTLQVSGAGSQTITQTFNASADTVTFSVMLNISTTGTYTFNCYTSNGNDVTPLRNGITKTFTINVTPPNPTVSGNSRCGDGTVPLTATGPGTMYWYTAAAGGSSIFTGNNFTTPVLSTTTTYYVQSNLVCPSSRMPVTASVHPQSTDPTPTPGSRCGTGTVSLNAASSDTVKWYDAPTGGNLIFTGTSYTTPSLNATTTYYALATNGFCQSARVAITATVSSAAADPTTTSSARCGAGSDTLIASAVDPVQWFNVASGGSPIDTSHTFITPSVSNTTTFYVEANNGCVSNRVAATVTVNPLATDPVPGSGSRCGTGAVVLSASGSDPISWFNSSTGGNVLTTGNTFTTPQITTTTDFFIEANNGTCPSHRVAVSAIILPLPTVNLGSDTTINDSAYHLNAGGGFANYSWSNGATTQTITINNTGTYCVTVTDAATCSNSDCIFVDLITGISDLESENFFSVYPNPVSEKTIVSISQNSGTALIEILNVEGQKIIQLVGQSGTESILDLSGVSKGIYFVRITTEKWSGIRRLIKE